MAPTIASVQISVEEQPVEGRSAVEASWKAFPRKLSARRKPRKSKGLSSSGMPPRGHKDRDPGERQYAGIGRLMKNTQRQERLSVSQPPSAGLNIGPRIAASRAYRAMTCPSCLGG